MKAALVALVLAALTVSAYAEATQEHPLEDAAKVIPDADEPALEDELRTLRTQGVDLAVVVINSTGGQSIEAYARKRAKGWATGTTPAAVFVLAIKDHKSRLEVSDPLRAKFPDARSQSILDNIKGYLRSGDFTGGVRAVITEIRNGVGGVAPDLESPHPQVATPEVGPVNTPIDPEPTPEPSYREPERKRDYTVLGFVIFGGAALLLGAFLWARQRVASRGTLTASGVMTSDRPLWMETLWCVVLILGGILYIAAIVLTSTSSSKSSSSNSWGSGSSSSSGGSSFSGGSSSTSSGGGWSGGGASSSW